MIDYYHDEQGVEHDQLPSLRDTTSVASIKVDARPALDSFESCFDRLRHLFSDTGQSLPKATPSQEPAVSEHVTDEDAAALVRTRCESALATFQGCTDEAQCAKAAMALNYCMGAIVCPDEAQQFVHKVDSGTADDAEAAYERLTNCLSRSPALKTLFQADDSDLGPKQS